MHGWSEGVVDAAQYACFTIGQKDESNSPAGVCETEKKKKNNTQPKVKTIVSYDQKHLS